MQTELFVGVDGGGSRCRVRVRDASGSLCGTAEGGSANVYLAFDNALATIRSTVAAAVSGHPLDRLHVGLGLAGVSSPAVAEKVRHALPGYASVAVENDGVAACLGAHEGADGGLVIAGTGSVAVLRLAGTTTTFGGRGFVLGDDGSGAQIGRAVWRRALRAFDGLEPSSALLDGLMARFDRDPVAIINWAREAPSHAFAADAPMVFQAASEGDPAALSVAAEGARAVSELILSLAGRGAPRISLTGGLAGVLTPFLDAVARDRLSPPRADALEGALYLAGLPRVQAP